MNLADIVFPLGMALVAVAVAILLALWILTRARNTDRRIGEDEQHVISDAPPPDEIQHGSELEREAEREYRDRGTP